MKTHEEFKKALECRIRACCGTCAYECGSCDVYVDRSFSKIFADGIRYIQQLEANWNQVSKSLCDKENATLEEVLQAINQEKTSSYALPARSGKTLAVQQAQRGRLFGLMTDCKNPVWNRFFSNSEMLQLTDHLLANNVTVQRWIPVTERLPDVEREYAEYAYSAELLVNTPDGLEVAYYCHGTKEWHDARFEDEIIEVTDWMPLPYKKENNNA